MTLALVSIGLEANFARSGKLVSATMADAMPRKKPAPPVPQPTRRRRGSGSVSVRSDSRVVVTLPADLDPERRPLYSPPGSRTAWA